MGPVHPSLLGNLAQVAPKPGAGATDAAEGKGSFASQLEGAVEQTEQAVKQADQTAIDGVTGKADAHEVALALEQADMQVRLMVKVRNKVVEAYQELMRMPV